MASKMDMKTLFSPSSVAVIGASRRPESVGQTVFSNILLNGYKGIVYPVNPRARSILGVKSYPRIIDIPDEVDLAVVVVPNRIVPGVIRECARKGVQSAIIISAGFKETGEEGKKLEEKVQAEAQKGSISLLGPNCLGLINTEPSISLNASFATSTPREGNVAFISQSGALCTAVLDYAKGQNIGFSKFISMGNKADITENELLRFLSDDPQTDVILMYLEDLHDEREFIRIAREITGEVSKGKPIIAVKSGRTISGARAASSHTGSLAGLDEVYGAIFAQCGVLRVDSVKQLFDYALAFSSQPLPKGNRVAIVTNAGGPGIMATDACTSNRCGLEMASFQNKTHLKLKSGLPPSANIQNPVDVIGDARHDRYELALGSVLSDRKVDGVVVILTPQTMTDIEKIASTIGRLSRKSSKPVLACFMGIVDVSKGEKILDSFKVPHYKFPEAACRSLAGMYHYVKWVKRPRTEVRTFQVDKVRAGRIINKALKGKREHLTEIEASQVLEAYGFPVLKSMLARNEKECLKAAGEIGYPVAMKIVSPDIIHKVDVKGVILGIENGTGLIKALGKMLSDVKKLKPKARIRGVNIQRMASPGREVIVGMKRDPHFGPLLMFGLGGIYVEALKDVTFRLAPVRELGALRMIKSIRAYRILEGMRGDKPADISALKECLERLSQLAIDFEEIQELDMNPVIVYNRGKGCRVVHARIVVGRKILDEVQ